jgi:ribulose-5-phosphate 4-epimerase/fuculose-1-phosphate aldolase
MATMVTPAFRRTDDEPIITDLDELRAHRRERLALGYQIFGAHGWGATGDGHITARDPILTDHYWLARYGVPFGGVTVDDLVLVTPDGAPADGNWDDINPAAHHIHWPIHEARPDIISAAHTHTPYGTPLCATVEPLRMISQEACAFFEDHSIFDDEELDIMSTDGGKRIAQALGANKAVLLRNHGLLTVGATVDEAVGWFVMLERVSEVQVKAGDQAKSISDAGARLVKGSVGPAQSGWMAFQWLVASKLARG